MLAGVMVGRTGAAKRRPLAPSDDARSQQRLPTNQSAYSPSRLRQASSCLFFASLSSSAPSTPQMALVLSVGSSFANRVMSSSFSGVKLAPYSESNSDDESSSLSDSYASDPLLWSWISLAP